MELGAGSIEEKDSKTILEIRTARRRPFSFTNGAPLALFNTDIQNLLNTMNSENFDHGHRRKNSCITESAFRHNRIITTIM